VRVALSHRVSTLDQDPAGARAELAAAAARLGAEVELDVEETGSGARNDRPGLRRVLEAVRRGRVDAVVVWKLDRFGRSALDLLANVRELEASGVRFLALSQGIDVRPGGDAMSRLLLTMLAAVAEFERDLIKDRTRLAMDRVRREGTRSGAPVGRPMMGADPSSDEIAALRASGESWRAIASRLGCSVSTARRRA
jgi:putative DNA-invertase from lambdoid prophage Rac